MVDNVVGPPPSSRVTEWPTPEITQAALADPFWEPTPFNQFVVKVHGRCNLSWNNRGEALLELGRPGEAIDWLGEALGVYHEIGTRTEAGDTLTNLGRACADCGHVADALDYLRQAEQSHRAVGYRYGEAITLELLGDVYLLDHCADDAAQAWDRALAIFETLGHEVRAREVRERIAGSGQVTRQERAQDG